jgi:hypothetical protein
MRSSRKRLTLRDLVVAVAAFALSLKLGLAYSRSASYWKEADFYANAGSSARFLAGILESDDKLAENRPPPSINVLGAERRHVAERSRKFAEDMDRKSSKYRRAVYLPWLPNTPEPPSS